MILRIAMLFFLLISGAAWAGLSRAALQSVSMRPPPGAHLDLSLSASDTAGKARTIAAILQGRPGFVNFVDYTCHTLCGTDLMLLADAVRRAGLKPDGFRIIAIGLDPKDGAAAALKMEREEIPPALRKVTTFLLPSKPMIAAATKALGFHFLYDAGADQFAHPAVVYAIAPDGSLRGTLSPLALTAGDLRQVMQSSASRPISLYDRIRSICYGYGPAIGLYTRPISLLLKLAGLATIMLLISALVLFSRRKGRRP